MKRNLILGILFCMAAVFAADPFKMPEGTKEINRDDSGKTWRMNGYIDSDFETAKKALCKSVEKSSFKKKHEIILDEKKQSVLIAWNKEAEKGKEKEGMIMMIWKGDDKKTFFSWGTFNE